MPSPFPLRRDSALLSLTALALLTLVACSPEQTDPPEQGLDSEPASTPRLAPGPPFPRPAVVVRSVFPTGPADLYGLRAGDVIHGWRHESATGGTSAGHVDSIWRARALEAGVAPAGGLVLTVRRDGADVDLEMASGSWEVELDVHDPTAPAAERIHRAVLADAEPSAETLDGWTELAAADEARGAASAARFSTLEAAGVAASLGQTDEAVGLFEKARTAFGALEPPLEAAVLQDEARRWQDADGPPAQRTRSTAAHARAVDLLRRHASNSAELTTGLANAPETALETAPEIALGTALVLQVESLPDKERLPPLEEALTLLSTHAPNSVDLARALNLRGIYSTRVEHRPDLATDFYLAAGTIRAQRIATSHRNADTLMNLASSMRLVGRLDETEPLVWKALEIYESVPELASRVAGGWNLLALVQRDLGQYRRARESWERALEIFRQVDPDGPAVAGVSNNLGSLSLRVGDFRRARQRFGEALELRRRLSPESAAVAASLNNLASVAVEEKNLPEARELFEQSLELKRRFAPGSLSFANTQQGFGRLAWHEGHLAEAEERLREALEIRDEQSPGSVQTAEICVLLGRVLAAAGRTDEAIESWQRGIQIFETTRQGFEFSAQDRSIFASRFQEHYRGLIALLARHGQVDEAFHLFELSRARALRLLAAHDEVDARGAATDDAAGGDEHPASTWPEIRSALDPGTRLVAYSVGVKETIVFVASADPAPNGLLLWRSIPIEREQLERKVELFRALLARGKDRPEVERALVRQAASLHDLLLGPFAGDLADGERWLIVPDRPLTTLPFAALVSDAERGEFVGEATPITYAISGTVFGLAKQRRPRAPKNVELTLFAKSHGFADLGARYAGLGELPGVGAEAQRLADLFGDNAEILLDEDATESAVKKRWRANLGGASNDQTLRLAHFATHAWTEPRAPLDSALLLGRAAAGDDGSRDDGVLTAREVIAELHLDSDLVTLSACDSGLGRDLGGEGVLGLSHAFVYSGARTLLTSLWQVSDRATSDWMETFYRRLRAGVDRDQAVLAAQRRVMASDDGALRHPYFWAAFQLWGDGAGLQPDSEPDSD